MRGHFCGGRCEKVSTFDIKVGKEIFSVPAMIEEIFSAAGNILTEKHNRLLPGNRGVPIIGLPDTYIVNGLLTTFIQLGFVYYSVCS